MLGIVLCGGQSLRMGTDKGLLNYETKTWSHLAIEKLGLLNIPVKLSVNNEQKRTYRNFFSEETLIADYASLDTQGPLLGVLSAHLSNQEEDLIILACDLLLMESRLLQQLVDSQQQDNSFDAYLYTDDNDSEPLCGIYTAKGLKKIIAMLNDQGLAKHSMKFILSQLRVCEIILAEKDKKYFRNFNSHSELNGLQ